MRDHDEQIAPSSATDSFDEQELSEIRVIASLETGDWTTRLCREILRLRREPVPPSAPDTKPDAVVPFCTICGKRATQQDIDGHWWPPCEHATTVGLHTFVHPGPWRTNVEDWKHWALGHGQPELARGVAQVFAMDLLTARGEIERLRQAGSGR